MLDLRVPRRQAQCVGGNFELQFHVVTGTGGNDGFQARLFFGELVEVGTFLGVCRVDGFELLLRIHHFAQAALDFFAHRLGGIELRLLR